MKRALIPTLVILAVLVFWPPLAAPASTPGDWTAGGPPAKPTEPAPGDFLPGQLIVKFRPSAPPSAISALAASYGLKEEGRIEELGARLMAVPEGQEWEVISKLSADRLVEYAEPNYLRHPLFVPNDPSYASYQWNLRIINMPQAWDISQGSASVKVSVIDSGIDTYHSDRPVNLFKGWNYVNNSYDVYDSLGHGTFVSGIVAAATNNGLGVASVAPGVSLVMHKAINPATGQFPIYALSNAIANAANNGAKVINLSLGSPDYSATEKSAIDYAWGKGSLIVASAGNCGAGSPSSSCTQINQIQYPAAFPNVLAVGSTTSTDTVAGHSTQNSSVDVSAPGQSVSSLRPGGGYASGSGTSFAAPHVSALAGLIWSVNPNLTNKQVGDMIVSTVKDLGPVGRDNG